MDREGWRAAIHGVTKSWTLLRDWTKLNLMHLAYLCSFLSLYFSQSVIHDLIYIHYLLPSLCLFGKGIKNFFCLFTVISLKLNTVYGTKYTTLSFAKGMMNKSINTVTQILETSGWGTESSFLDMFQRCHQTLLFFSPLLQKCRLILLGIAHLFLRQHGVIIWTQYSLHYNHKYHYILLKG